MSRYKSLRSKVCLMLLLGIAVSGGVQAADMTKSNEVIPMASSGDVVYDKYEAHNNWYVYGHESKDPSQITGGTITVKHAKQIWGYTRCNSDIMLGTDSNGINTSDADMVHKVLNNLAGKLTYTAYTMGEDNLTAEVMIGEGLTSSSYVTQTNAYTAVHFDTTTGKGYTSLPTVVMAKDSKNVDIDKYQEFKQTYIYSHNASDPTQIYGGNINIKKADSVVNSSSMNVRPNLQRYPSVLIVETDANGINGNNTDQVSKVLKSLAAKVIYPNGANSSSVLTAYAKIAEGLTTSDQMLGYGEISFDKTTGVGTVSSPSVSHTYTGVITGDLEKDKANGYNGKDYNLTKGDNNIKYFSIRIKPQAADTSKDAVLAIVKPDAGKSITMNLAGSGSTDLGSGGTSFDVSNLSAPNGKVYVIYNNGGGEVSTGNSQASMGVSGSNPNLAGLIYAANPNGDTKSTFTSESDVDVTARSDNFVALEAGKNGEITFKNSSGTMAIHSGGHKIVGVQAENGGVVNLGNTGHDRTYSVSIDAGEGGKALYAKDGGTINLLNGTMYIKDVVGDIVSEGTGKISTVSFENGSWKGNLDANTHVELSGSTWTGDVKNRDATVSLVGESTWTGKLIDGGTLGLSISNWNDTNMRDTEIGTFNGSLTRGLRGVINKTAGNLTIDNYSGDGVIAYSHEASNPSRISGPEVTIKKAAESSSITLRTDSNGMNLDNSSQVESVLSAMADKLTYSAYVQGERNLSGSAEIAEGLTAGSRALEIGKLGFDGSTGKASVTGSLAKAYNAPITGNLAKDTAYASVAKSDGDATTYTFTGDTYINNTMSIEGATSNPGNMKYGITVYPDEGKAVVLDMQGHDLTIENNIGQGKMAQSTTSVIYPVNNKSSVYIKNPGKIDLSTFSGGYYGGGIAAGDRAPKTADPSNVTIDNASDWDHAVKIRGVMGMGGTNFGNIFNVNWTTMKAFNHGHIDIKGLADFYAYGAWNLSAIGNDGWIKIGGGKFISDSYDSVDAYDKGSIWLNAQGTPAEGNMASLGNVLQIGGNIHGSGQWVGSGSGGNIYAAFDRDDSWFDGIANADGGSINLIFRNGAKWTNKDGGFRYGGDSTFDGTTKSSVDYFYGADSADKTGFIEQRQEGDLSFNHYQGYTTVYYNHDSSDATRMLGGYTVVKSAVQTDGKNAEIALRTDSNGIDLDNSTQVESVLNNLAHKLIYDGYTTGERNLNGYAQIAEGMTSSSYTKQLPIYFDENSGDGRTTVEPSGQLKTLFTTQLTGNAAADEEYKRAGVIADGKYTFSEASVIRIPDSIQYGGGDGFINLRKKTTTIIDAKNGLTLDNTNPSSKGVRFRTGLYANDGSKLDYTGDLSINLTNFRTFGSQYGISARDSDNNKTELTFNGNTNISINQKLTELASVDKPRGERIKGISTMVGKESTIDMNGLVNIDVDGTGVVADNRSDVGGTINIKGGKIIAENVIAIDYFKDGATAQNLNNHALTAYNGTINVGMVKEAADTAADGTEEAGSTSSYTYKPGSTTVNVKGNVLTMKDSLTSARRRNLTDGTINLALMTPNSSWTGVADNAGVDKLGTFNLYLQNGGLWTNEKQGSTYNYLTSDKPLGGTWDGISHVTSLTGGSDDGHTGLIDQSSGTPVEVENYSGYTTIYYGHDSENPSTINGGSFTVDHAAEGSEIKLLTDSNGIDTDSDTDTMKKVLQGMAEKLVYSDAANGATNLKATAVIGEGLTSPSAAYEIGNVSFSSDTGAGSLDESSMHYNTADTNPIYKGRYETLIMSGSKSAMASAALLWRTGLRDMEQRLGNIHDASYTPGLWAQVYGGKNSMDKDSTKYKDSYTTYQVGYDRPAGGRWRAGAALSYTKGDGDYILGGDGTLKNTVFTLYGTRISEHGAYLDIVAKGGHVKNEYTVYNEWGHHVDGDYGANGYSLSLEYGKQFKKDSGFYLEPQAQLVWGHLGSSSYTATSDMVDGSGNKRTMDVKQDGFDSFIGRLGLSAGKTFRNGSNFYAKVSFLKEFDGDFDSHFNAEEMKSTHADFSGGWTNLQLGGSIVLNRDTYFYFDYSRNVGNSDLADDWSIAGGIRYSF